MKEITLATIQSCLCLQLIQNSKEMYHRRPQRPASLALLEAQVILLFFGYGPNCELQECGGHCNSNSDCASGLFCLPSDGKDNRVVPGCLTVPYKDVNYCVSKKFQPKPNARHGTPNRVLLEEKIDDIKPGRYIIKSIYGTSICIKDNVKLVKDIEGKEVFIRSMGGKKYAIHSHEQESYMYVKGSGSNRRITTQPHAHSYELFYIISRSEDDTVVSFQSAKWNNYLKAEGTGDGKNVYTSTNLGGKEQFTLIFKPSQIDDRPEYTYRMNSRKYKTNLRIPKYGDEVGLTNSNGSAERIVIRPICNPDCYWYALKSAEFGERYVSMPKKSQETVGLQTRVGKNELMRIDKLSYVFDEQCNKHYDRDTGVFEQGGQVIFKGAYNGDYHTYMAADGETLKTTQKFMWVNNMFMLYKE